MSVYDALHARYGDLGWWPAESPFEVMVGAVLTQRTAWRNVEIALDNLRGSGVTDMASLLDTTTEELETLVRPSGTYRQKAARLKALFEHVDLVGDGSLEEYLDRPLETLREDLLSVNGIGPETADSIILYAADRPVFVVDAYTRRVLGRLDIDPGRSYDDVAGWFMDGLPRNADIYNNFHACLVELAKSHCRRDPSCRGCPLGPVCPTGRGEKTP
ncbi:MAG: endonuclease III domain-containing protein [Thermoplasmata archaeon]|nr:MAG: endonuclease III domain-containing protein [Thermoplasmata archaeon]